MIKLKNKLTERRRNLKRISLTLEQELERVSSDKETPKFKKKLMVFSTDLSVPRFPEYF